MVDWSKKREGRMLGLAYGKLGLPPVGFSMSGTAAEMSVNRNNGVIKVHNNLVRD